MYLTIGILICFLWQVFNSIYPHFEFVVIAATFIVYGCRHRIVIPNIMLMGSIFAIHTLLCLMNNTLNITDFIIQFFSVALSYLFYYNLVKRYRPEDIIKRYCKVAFGFAVFGLFQELFALFGNYTLMRLFFLVKGMKLVFIFGPLVRIEGLCTEPFNFALLLIPAVYCAMRRFLFKDGRIYNQVEAAVVLLAFMLTFSGAGMVGLVIAVILLLLDKGQKKTKNPLKTNQLFKGFILVASFTVVFIWAYLNIPMITWRVDDTIAVLFKGVELEKANMSTYAIASNLIVARNEMAATYGLGVGFGSYGANFNRYSTGLDTTFYAYGINQLDGSNLAIRFAAEMGIIGIAFIIWCLVKYRRHVTGENLWMSNAVLVQLLLRIIRFGNYTMFGLGLFVSLYVVIGTESKQKLSNQVITKAPMIEEKE